MLATTCILVKYNLYDIFGFTIGVDPSTAIIDLRVTRAVSTVAELLVFQCVNSCHSQYSQMCFLAPFSDFRDEHGGTK